VSVWYAIPSKRPVAEAEMCLSQWREKGYRLALFRDAGDEPIPCDLLLTGEYGGYHVAVNALCKEIMARDPEASWIVTGGDDMKPDPNKMPSEIAAECEAHFGGTFGVMQPTGDMKLWSESRVDKICGSPWMGREFCRRMYGGNGPFWPNYYHMFGDEEMHEVAKKLGILWNREDLSHYHHHFIREAREKGKPIVCPDFLIKANAAYDVHLPEFKWRKAHGFPGHEPIA